MAMRGKPLDMATIQKIQRLVKSGSIKAAARGAHVDRQTVRKYTRPPKPL